ncbi:MAG: M3 family metallopeptidase [Hyphomicrobiaceae bacterium]|nr:M3 family metallopeptidase [Hyphomicrobiaceae bacterium]
MARSITAPADTVAADRNPLLEPWRTPFGMPPFAAIEARHFATAFATVLAEHRQAIRAIADNEATPTFANTIAAIDKSWLPVDRVADVFFNLTSAATNPALQELERAIAPQLAAHHSAINLDPRLFARIADLYERRASLRLDAEQSRLIERYYTWFTRAGAALKPKAKKRVAAINERLASLTTAFNQNVLADEQAWHMVLRGPADLAGLPPTLVASARQAAIDLAIPDDQGEAHAITLARSSVEGFLTFSSRRDLREKAFRAWTSRGANGGPTDNAAIIAEVAALRAEFAELMGYPTFADYSLADTMAKSPQAVRDLLGAVWQPALARAAEERDALAARARAEGANYSVAAWDWRYLAEKERKARFDLDDGEVRPYLVLDNILAAAFDTASRLFGLTFTELPDAPRYHPDVRVFEVRDRDGEHLAVFMGDYFARSGKRSGAWMSTFRTAHKLGGKRVRPIVVNVMSCSKGAPGAPTLLSFDDARTLFHEFGHGLHGMLSETTYPSIAGTAVARDFVELPSQLYEHWLSEPSVLRRFALHHKTRKPMPKTTIDRIKKASTFNQGFATVEFTACALLDMELHATTRESAAGLDAARFEKSQLARIGMPDEIVMRHRLPHFMHVMGGYAAGYYSYLWSEVMDTDAFEAFRETGDVFDPDVAGRLRQFIYAAGNSRDPEVAWLAFRGRPPSVDGLLKRRGLA